MGVVYRLDWMKFSNPGIGENYIYIAKFFFGGGKQFVQIVGACNIPLNGNRVRAECFYRIV